MIIPANPFKAALKAGRPQIGIWGNLCSEVAADIVATAGFDWIVIDMEHSTNDLTDVVRLMRAFATSGTHVVVRPPSNDPVVVKRLLDQGVFSFLFPMVQSAEEAALAVSACRYPPAGIRGVSLSHRGNAYGLARADYLARAEAEITVLVQIESRQALQAIDEIASVDGVDGVFFGPADLSADFGLLGQPGHPEVVAAITDGIARLKALGKPAGTLTGSAEDARAWIKAGMVFVAAGTEQGVLAQGVRALRAAAAS